jgi:hypothetical protein
MTGPSLRRTAPAITSSRPEPEADARSNERRRPAHARFNHGPFMRLELGVCQGGAWRAWSRLSSFRPPAQRHWRSSPHSLEAGATKSKALPCSTWREVGRASNRLPCSCPTGVPDPMVATNREMHRRRPTPILGPALQRDHLAATRGRRHDGPHALGSGPKQVVEQVGV